MPPDLHRHWELRLAAATALVAGAGLGLLGPAWTPWLVVALGASLGWLAYSAWYWTRGPGAARRGLELLWLALPGARLGPERAVHVHDGYEPIRVMLGREEREPAAIVEARSSESTLAFRVWPAERSGPPPFPGAEARPALGDLERALEVEAIFAHLLRAEANAPSELRRVLDPDAMAALLAVRKEAGRGFAGLTWDGQRLAVHLRGPLVADPARALQLARAVWRPLGDW